MVIKSFVFNPFYENTYVIHDQSKKAVIVDPGCYESYEQEELVAYIDQNQLDVEMILNTHCHIDHVLGNHFLKEKYKVPLKVPAGETELLDSVKDYSSMWGINYYAPATVDELLQEGEITFGNSAFQAILAPGHSPGHLVFHLEKERIIIGGDVLFRESIGRTDLPGGNHQQLLDSIKDRLFTLPDDVTVYPGHGPETTIGHEKQYNPFLQ